MTATATVTAPVKEKIIYQQSTGDCNRDRKWTGMSVGLLQAGNRKLKREQSTGGDSNISKLQRQHQNLYH